MTTTTESTITDPEMEATHYGIAVAYIGDDGETLMALGHHGKRRTFAAFNRHARVFVGLINLADDRAETLEGWLDDMKETRAVFRTPDPSQGEHPDMQWYADWSDPDAPGAVPVTLLDL
ncbi:hypothetical protein GLX30_30200 [Streptomyces sp. Tu 2975]|uniref:hypothetical protein n=1 Tax=Streptomyces sp. Tu 2975 TaxID=2676871 RepID=UPI00135C7084|nr:hypothetical protein [Streptomyces sp. Tu 2975]QIP87589.1 hypothetical protein GLX30_30200 [Streptomyces sp. Tu 2975]